MMSTDGVYVTTERHQDSPPCLEILEVRGDSGAGTLTCNLKLPFHKVHHDPSGYWWAACQLTDHEHQG